MARAAANSAWAVTQQLLISYKHLFIYLPSSSFQQNVAIYINAIDPIEMEVAVTAL